MLTTFQYVLSKVDSVQHGSSKPATVLRHKKRRFFLEVFTTLSSSLRVAMIYLYELELRYHRSFLVSSACISESLGWSWNF